MVASDDDRCLELATGHHFVEGQPQTMTLSETHPADARRQTLKMNALLRHVEPAMQVANGERFGFAVAMERLL